MRPKICGLTTMADKAFLTKRVMVSAMHELKSDSLSEAENLRIFGKCYKTHGHNYYLEATVEGAIDSASGLSCDRDFFDDVLKKEIVDTYSGTHLNQHFKSTTGEELAREFYGILFVKLKPLKLVHVRLQETPKNFFDYGDQNVGI